MEESWIKTTSIGKTLTIKEHEINDELQNAKKIFISVRYVSNITWFVIWLFWKLI